MKCTIDTHKKPDGTNTTMWNLIPRNSVPPTRINRYCCRELKETGGKGRFIATGVRWAESARRKQSHGVMETSHRDKNKRIILMDDNDERRMLLENCQLKARRTVNPIIDWEEKDVLGYCAEQNITMNPLYGCGWKRVGCIGCPLAKKATRYAEFARYPKIKAAYVRAFDRMLNRRKERVSSNDWQNGEDVMHWWLEDGVLPGQLTLEEMKDET